ncbi:MAG: substrate-binding domain-containing protein [Anaerostipes sp.]|nr:substrate-binding domain-containing protein [Anaerostipes sp.]
MFQKKAIWMFLMVCTVVGLCACGKDSTNNQQTMNGLDKLGSVKIVSREEGSGTRTTFADLVGLGEMSNSTDNSDDTTKKAHVVDNAEKVVEYVGNNKNVIGYVPSGEILKNQNEKIKAINVNGKKATSENIAKGKYDLSRSFYLTYTGKLRDVERDFISYIQGKGQETVGKNFVPIGKPRSFLSDKSSGTITIHGSTSMSGLLEELAKQYMKLNTNAKIKVEVSDSTSGLNDAMKGICDFGMSSRELKDYEKELLNYETIAKDGITVIVNKDNPVTNLSTKQLKALYKGSLTKWNDLNTKEK